MKVNLHQHFFSRYNRILHVRTGFTPTVYTCRCIAVQRGAALLKLQYLTSLACATFADINKVREHGQSRSEHIHYYESKYFAEGGSLFTTPFRPKTLRQLLRACSNQGLTFDTIFWECRGPSAHRVRRHGRLYQLDRSYILINVGTRS